MPSIVVLLRTAATALCAAFAGALVVGGLTAACAATGETPAPLPPQRDLPTGGAPGGTTTSDPGAGNPTEEILASLPPPLAQRGGGASGTPGDAAPAPRRSAPPEMRILLTGVQKARRGRVRVRGAWRLVDVAGGALATGTALDASLTLDGRPTLGATVLPRDGAVLVPGTPGDLRVDERRYPGTLRITPSVDGAWQVRVATDLEAYLAGVVPGEIPATFPREAQRTQAIIARTYALSSIERRPVGDVVLLSDSGGDDQEYVGIPEIEQHRAVALDAVATTHALVLCDGDLPLRAWYHSTCGGHTADATTVFPYPDREPLRGVTCSWCTSSKYFRWSTTLDPGDVVRAARLAGRLESFAIAERDASGRATRFRVVAGGRTALVKASEFRVAVGASALRSCRLDDVVLDADGLHVAGRGWGHGVGLCQVGAKALAESGMRAEEIVRTYYPGARLVRLW